MLSSINIVALKRILYINCIGLLQPNKSEGDTVEASNVSISFTIYFLPRKSF